MTTVAEGDGIGARLVVGHIEQGDLRPCVAVVRGERGAYLSVAGAHEHL